MRHDLSPAHGPQEGDEAKKQAKLEQNYLVALKRFPVLKGMTRKEAIVFLARQYASVAKFHDDAIKDIIALEKKNKE